MKEHKSCLYLLLQSPDGLDGPCCHVVEVHTQVSDRDGCTQRIQFRGRARPFTGRLGGITQFSSEGEHDHSQDD